MAPSFMYEGEHPDITTKTLGQIYLDDWIGGAKTHQQAAEDIRLIIRILGEIKMNLYKWSNNSTELTKMRES
jgi:hypothetical protein